MLTIGGDCTGQDIGKILTERERQVITPTKYFGIDYICCMNTFLGGIFGIGNVSKRKTKLKVGDTIFKAYFRNSYSGELNSVIIVSSSKKNAEIKANKIGGKDFEYVSNPIKIANDYILFEETRNGDKIYK